MLNYEGISDAFDKAAAHPVVAAEQHLRHAFSDVFRDDLDNTVARVVEVLKAMGLPLPDQRAIVSGAVGTLIPLDQYGVMLRIEQSDRKLAVGQRVDAHPMVLQPLGQRQLTDGAVLEICAGCRMTDREEYSRLLVEKLPQTGVDFWDDGVTNIGLLPFTTPEYPDGVPVVIDRLAVDKLGDAVAPVKDALAVFGLTEDMQARYQPLKDAFDAAWPEGADIPAQAGFAQFKQMCVEFKQRGDLVTGWAQPAQGAGGDSFEADKSRKVSDAGKAYAAQISAKVRTP